MSGLVATLVSMSRAANGAAAMGERGLLSSAFAVSPDLSLSPFRSCQKSGTFRGNVEVQSRGIANAGMRSKRTRAGFMQGVVAAAKDVWSIAGANTARQAMMGMGAGVATEDVLTVRHDTEVREVTMPDMIGTNLVFNKLRVSCEIFAKMFVCAQGTGIELWHGSFGWFDFMAYDGIQCTHSHSRTHPSTNTRAHTRSLSLFLSPSPHLTHTHTHTIRTHNMHLLLVLPSL